MAAMQAAFDEAAQRRSDVASVQNLSLGGKAVLISIVGKTLTGIFADAFFHLIRPGTTPKENNKLSIALWDRSEAGVAAPPRPSGEEWQSEGAGWQLYAYDDLRFTCEERPESVIWCDRATGCLIAMFEDARKFLLYEKARPLSRRFPDFCRHLGVQNIHAAGIASEGKGVIIVGGSGRGKTSTSVDCLAGGLHFLGDDSVVITDDESGFTVHSLYASARVDPHQTPRWNELTRFWIPPGPRDDKSLLMPIAVPGARVAADAPVRAIVIPNVGDGPVHFQRAQGNDAFHALVGDSRENWKFSLNLDQFRRFVRLTQSVPVYSLQIGPDPAAVSDAMKRIAAESGE